MNNSISKEVVNSFKKLIDKLLKDAIDVVSNFFKKNNLKTENMDFGKIHDTLFSLMSVETSFEDIEKTDLSFLTLNEFFALVHLTNFIDFLQGFDFNIGSLADNLNLLVYWCDFDTCKKHLS